MTDLVDFCRSRPRLHLLMLAGWVASKSLMFGWWEVPKLLENKGRNLNLNNLGDPTATPLLN